MALQFPDFLLVPLFRNIKGSSELGVHIQREAKCKIPRSRSGLNIQNAAGLEKGRAPRPSAARALGPVSSTSLRVHRARTEPTSPEQQLHVVLRHKDRPCRVFTGAGKCCRGQTGLRDAVTLATSAEAPPSRGIGRRHHEGLTLGAAFLGEKAGRGWDPSGLCSDQTETSVGVWEPRPPRSGPPNRWCQQAFVVDSVLGVPLFAQALDFIEKVQSFP